MRVGSRDDGGHFVQYILEPNDPATSGSVTERATAQIREAILRGRLPAGARIPMQQLSDEMGTSHIPIREALRRLEGEALVESRAHRWSVVSDLSLQELEDVYELRRLIEGAAAHRAASRYQEEDLVKIRRAVQDLTDSQASPSSEAFWNAHRSLHLSILEPGLTPWSRRLLRLLWQSAERYQRLYATVPGSIDSANEDHHDLARLAEEGDAEAIREVAVQHLHTTESALKRAWVTENGAASDVGTPEALAD